MIHDEFSIPIPCPLSCRPCSKTRKLACQHAHYEIMSNMRGGNEQCRRSMRHAMAVQSGSFYSQSDGGQTVVHFSSVISHLLQCFSQPAAMRSNETMKTGTEVCVRRQLILSSFIQNRISLFVSAQSCAFPEGESGIQPQIQVSRTGLTSELVS